MENKRALQSVTMETGLGDGRVDARLRKGRGAVSNRAGRFESHQREAWDDGWGTLDQEPEAKLRTELIKDSTRTIITRNKSPDIPFDRSINPYRGCEHGCIYCFARPSHTYLGYGAGMDFETKILFKPEAAQLLEGELAKKSYRCGVIAMGTNTDPYQPVERDQKIMRSILEVLQAHNHPFSIVTKNKLILRDLDILSDMAAKNLASVAISVTTLDPALSRALEPRASSPANRLKAAEALVAAGVPTGVMAAPMIPALNEVELEAILAAARDVGVQEVGYILLRMPHEISDLFEEWLQEHLPDRAAKVMNLIRECREGKVNQAAFGRRMVGSGVYAQLLNKRFHLACKNLGLNALTGGSQSFNLDVSQFKVPPKAGDQMLLF